MITKIYFSDRRDSDGKEILWTNDVLIDHIIVKDFKEGIVTVEVLEKHIGHIASMLAGCFQPESNFSEVVKVIFNKLTEEVKAIEFELKGVKVLVTPEDTPDKIYEKWRNGLLAEEDKKEKMKADLKNINEIFASVEFLRRPEISEQEYEKMVAEIGNSTLLENACNWAKLMQYVSAKYRKSIADIEDMTAKAMRLTYVERTAMKLILEIIWKYGDEFANDFNDIMLEIAIVRELF